MLSVSPPKESVIRSCAASLNSNMHSPIQAIRLVMPFGFFVGRYSDISRLYSLAVLRRDLDVAKNAVALADWLVRLTKESPTTTLARPLK
mgnify:CR=1 FL=1